MKSLASREQIVKCDVIFRTLDKQQHHRGLVRLQVPQDTDLGLRLDIGPGSIIAHGSAKGLAVAVREHISLLLRKQVEIRIHLVSQGLDLLCHPIAYNDENLMIIHGTVNGSEL